MMDSLSYLNFAKDQEFCSLFEKAEDNISKGRSVTFVRDRERLRGIIIKEKRKKLFMNLRINHLRINHFLRINHKEFK